jgi:major membrane immunogen (membrane-anchored lipoprotein)
MEIMKGRTVFFCLAILLTGVLVVAKDRKRDCPQSPASGSVEPALYRDGKYEAEIRKDFEGYHAEACVIVKNGLVDSVAWRIVDNNNGRVFDDAYEDQFREYPAYIQQCRDNLAGMRTFVPRLLQTQNMDSVECVTGATWSYAKFRDAVRAALKKACADSTASR